MNDDLIARARKRVEQLEAERDRIASHPWDHDGLDEIQADLWDARDYLDGLCHARA